MRTWLRGNAGLAQSPLLARQNAAYAAAEGLSQKAGGGARMQPDIRVRRVYDDPEPQDGARVLVDRMWPRGLRKDAAQLDEWAKEIAPSMGLRTWYGHDPAKFDEFCRRYVDELSGDAPRAAFGWLRELAAKKPVTLLTATTDVAHSQAAVLARLLRSSAEPAAELPGEAACWAHLVCPECGAMTSEGHREGCGLRPG
jgi:uncharacterized protein YeaO (DUF488 family)